LVEAFYIIPQKWRRVIKQVLSQHQTRKGNQRLYPIAESSSATVVVAIRKYISHTIETSCKKKKRKQK
jgi:hypothetical protein